MPLLLDKYESNYRLTLWHLTETIEELEEKASLLDEELIVYAQITNKTRKREWLAIRILLNEVLGFWPHISYLETGKPIFNNFKMTLSISHTKEMVGILLSNSEHTGIDIEKKTRAIDNILPRFLSPIELAGVNINEEPNSKIIYWCAKEAIFKAVDDTDIDFSTHIAIDELTLKGNIKGKFLSTNGEICFNLKYIEIENHVIVWTS